MLHSFLLLTCCSSLDAAFAIFLNLPWLSAWLLGTLYRSVPFSQPFLTDHLTKHGFAPVVTAIDQIVLSGSWEPLQITTLMFLFLSRSSALLIFSTVDLLLGGIGLSG